jgi:hypothetical protein
MWAALGGFGGLLSLKDFLAFWKKTSALLIDVDCDAGRISSEKTFCRFPV